MNRQRKGFALISAMWLLVAIAAVALQFALRAKERRVTAINAVEGDQARAAAEAGIQTSLARLERLVREAAGISSGSGDVVDNTDPWQRADSLCSETVVLENTSYNVVLRDAGSLLNVNGIGEDQWRNFLVGAGVDDDDADKLAQSISDWRDSDDDPHSAGAEREQYINSGALVLPTNRDFASVSDLQYVLGMTPDVYAKIAPYLKVSGGNLVNVNTASVPVLRSIPGMTDEIVAAIQQAQQSGVRIRSVQEFLSIMGGDGGGRGGRRRARVQQLQSLFTFSTQEVEVQSTGLSQDNRTRITLSAVITRRGSQAQVTWRRYT